MDRIEMLRAYKESPPPMGVFAVRNTAEGRALIGGSPNVAGRLNRERFALEMGSHLSKPLQADWNRLGESAFAFEVLDTLEPSDDPDFDSSAELSELAEMWAEKLGYTAETRYPPR